MATLSPAFRGPLETFSGGSDPPVEITTSISRLFGFPEMSTPLKTDIDKLMLMGPSGFYLGNLTIFFCTQIFFAKYKITATFLPVSLLVVTMFLSSAIAPNLRDPRRSAFGVDGFTLG